MTVDKVYLHLGCGKRFIPGYIHVDLDNYSHIDYQARLDDLSMFEDNSVDLIYSSHALEYFDRIEVRSVLAEWRRVMKTNAVLRLAVPDFEALIQIYMNTNDLNNILGPLFGRIKVKSPDSETVLYHKTVYDFQNLKNLLEENGFGDVRRFDWRETELIDYDDYSQAYFPHMDKENGQLVSLNVEANKT